MAQPPKTLSDLSFDRIWSTQSEKDRDTTLTLSTFNGRASFTVFSGKSGGPPKFKLPLPPQFPTLMRAVFAQVRKMAPGDKLSIPIQDWNRETKKMVQSATVVFGIDDKKLPYIGLVGTEFDSTKFPLRSNLRWDTSAVTQLDQTNLAIQTFLDACETASQAATLTNFKYDPNQRPGGSRPGGFQRPSVSSDLDDEIPF